MSEFPCASVSNHSYKNDFDLHENETACRTHFHMKGFVLRLVLKQRHKRTRKWPIERRRCIFSLITLLEPLANRTDVDNRDFICKI